MINELRVQLGREINKENKTKSWQDFDEQYHLSWPFWSQAQFLRPVVTATKIKDNLTSKSCFDVENEEDKEDVQSSLLAKNKQKQTN